MRNKPEKESLQAALREARDLSEREGGRTEVWIKGPKLWIVPTNKPPENARRICVYIDGVVAMARPASPHETLREAALNPQKGMIGCAPEMLARLSTMVDGADWFDGGEVEEGEGGYWRIDVSTAVMDSLLDLINRARGGYIAAKKRAEAALRGET